MHCDKTFTLVIAGGCSHTIQIVILSVKLICDQYHVMLIYSAYKYVMQNGTMFNCTFFKLVKMFIILSYYSCNKIRDIH